MPETKTCENCGEEFAIKNKYAPAKTCSKECRYALSARTNSTAARGRREHGTCANPDCAQPIEFSVNKPKRYCSKACYNRMRAESLKFENSCAECGGRITNYHRQDAIYCSVPCRNKGVAKKRTKNFPKCKVCGISTESYNRQYCDEHRPSPGRPALPRKKAICLGCGEEFERPGTWPGKMNYCSNRCSHSQRKKVRDKYVLNLNDKAVVFHSGWEVRFYAACLRFGIPVRSYDGPDIETRHGLYRPDFIAFDEEVVEVKGWMSPDSANKIADAVEQGHDILVISKDALERFEETGMKPIQTHREQAEEIEAVLDGVNNGDVYEDAVEPGEGIVALRKTGV